MVSFDDRMKASENAKKCKSAEGRTEHFGRGIFLLLPELHLHTQGDTLRVFTHNMDGEACKQH